MAISLSEQEIFSMRSVLIFQLLISIVIVFAYFSRDLTLYKKSTSNILIFAILIRDLIEDEQVKPDHIDRKKNSTNILTKNLDQVLFSHFHLFLG